MRRADWEVGFNAVVDDWNSKPFVWGETDCARFAIACVEAIRNEDAVPAWPKWKTEIGARKVIAKEGGLGACWANRLDEVPPVMASRGDIGIVEYDGAECTVVCNGSSWVGKAPSGIITVPRAQVTRAFRV